MWGLFDLSKNIFGGRRRVRRGARSGIFKKEKTEICIFQKIGEVSAPRANQIAERRLYSF
jgi:hypothetical protein